MITSFIVGARMQYMMILHYIMNTVNYDNFFEFGVDTGDAELNEYGPSPTITLSTPIQLFGRTWQAFIVSQLCIYTFTFIWSSFQWTYTNYHWTSFISIQFFGVPQSLNLLQGTFTFLEVEIIADFVALIFILLHVIY